MNNEQYMRYSIYSSLLMLINRNTVIHCLLVTSALTNVKKYNLWF